MEQRATPRSSDVTRWRDQRGNPIHVGALRAPSVRADGEAKRFHGEAIVFNEATWIGSARWGFRERIAPEAVKRSLDEGADVRFLQNHDANLVLGRTTSGTLALRATESALEVDADLPAVSYASDLAVLLERGDVSQMSFAFEPLEWTTRELDNGDREYTITDLNLFDVSVVTFPAYESTSAGLRARARQSNAARLARASLAIASARVLEQAG
jgi:HK97 family phage prohead protease